MTFWSAPTNLMWATRRTPEGRSGFSASLCPGARPRRGPPPPPPPPPTPPPPPPTRTPPTPPTPTATIPSTATPTPTNTPTLTPTPWAYIDKDGSNGEGFCDPANIADQTVENVGDSHQLAA